MRDRARVSVSVEVRVKVRVNVSVKVEVIKLLGMVNAVPEYGDQPKVINGCSDLLVVVLGENGRHARSAVGMGSLPGNMPVEIEAIIRVLP